MIYVMYVYMKIYKHICICLYMYICNVYINYICNAYMKIYKYICMLYVCAYIYMCLYSLKFSACVHLTYTNPSLQLILLSISGWSLLLPRPVQQQFQPEARRRREKYSSAIPLWRPTSKKILRATPSLAALHLANLHTSSWRPGLIVENGFFPLNH